MKIVVSIITGTLIGISMFETTETTFLAIAVAIIAVRQILSEGERK